MNVFRSNRCTNNRQGHLVARVFQLPEIANNRKSIFDKSIIVVSKSTCCVTEITVSVRQSPPDLIKSTTCLCVAPSTFTLFLQEEKERKK